MSMNMEYMKTYTVNSLYCRHPWDCELESLIARVRNSRKLFQSNVCKIIFAWDLAAVHWLAWNEFCLQKGTLGWWIIIVTSWWLWEVSIHYVPAAVLAVAPPIPCVCTAAVDLSDPWFVFWSPKSVLLCTAGCEGLDTPSCDGSLQIH